MKNIIALLFAFMAGISSLQAAKEIKLTSDNTVVLRESFNGKSMTELKKDLIRLNSQLKSGYPIYLVLYTPGGEIQEGLELFEFIKGLNRPVHTVTMFAASMGFQTVQHLGKRYILRYGVLMSHKARGGFKGEFGGNGISQLDSRYGLWLRRVEMMDRVTVDRTNGKQTFESYTSSYAPELWLNGPEAVEKGYADELAEVSCDATLLSPENQRETVFNALFFKIKVKFSGCPLLASPLSAEVTLLTNKGEMSLEEFLSKDGKFGKTCRDSETQVEQDLYNNKVTPSQPAELCAKGKDLSLDKLNKSLEEKVEWLNRDLKNHIEYSY